MPRVGRKVGSENFTIKPSLTLGKQSKKLLLEAMIKLFVAAVVALGFITAGYGAECTTENINIGTARSGRVIRGQPEWKVSVINNCKCAQKAVVLSCDGFETVENLDPNIVLKQADGCLVAKGNPIRSFASVSFSYAWYPPFVFMPRNSTVLC